MSTHATSRLGFWYRVRWRISYLLLHAYGPADLAQADDPRAAMRVQRRARELAMGPPHAPSRPALDSGSPGPPARLRPSG